MKIFSAILVAGLFISLQGCVNKGAPISVLGRTEFVPQSSPDSTVETGIRQDPYTGGLLLQWYMTQGAVRYEIFRSDTTAPNGGPILFAMILNLTSSSVLSDTTAIDGSVVTGVKYYYYIVAYASDGSHSVASDTISYELINRPFAITPDGNTYVGSSGLYFSWVDNTGGGYTVLTLQNISQVPVTTIWITRAFEINESYPSEVFNFDSTATQDWEIGHSYQWRVERFNVDGTGRPYEGSTSGWSTFTVK